MKFKYYENGLLTLREPHPGEYDDCSGHLAYFNGDNPLRLGWIIPLRDWKYFMYMLWNGNLKAFKPAVRRWIGKKRGWPDVGESVIYLFPNNGNPVVRTLTNRGCITHNAL